MCDCSCERPTFFESSMPTARKPHRCCECKRLIRAGEVYERVVGNWPTLDGFETHATCLECLETWKIVAPDGCRCFTGLADMVFDGPWIDRRSPERMTLPLIRFYERYRAYWRQKKSAAVAGG